MKLSLSKLAAYTQIVSRKFSVTLDWQRITDRDPRRLALHVKPSEFTSVILTTDPSSPTDTGLVISIDKELWLLAGDHLGAPAKEWWIVDADTGMDCMVTEFVLLTSLVANDAKQQASSSPIKIKELERISKLTTRR